MNKIFLFWILPFFAMSQIFTVDDNYIECSDNYTVSNFSANTFLNTFSEVSISYEIIVDSMPFGWDFQNCFPTCHPINTYSVDAINFPADSSIYLNGHFYPNNIIGEGLMIMELSAQHGLYLDTITWRGEALLEVDLEEDFFNNSSIKKIHTIHGQLVKDFSDGNIFFVTFEDNTTKTYYVVK